MNCGDELIATARDRLDEWSGSEGVYAGAEFRPVCTKTRIPKKALLLWTGTDVVAPWGG
jgi:hypothetical protein